MAKTYPEQPAVLKKHAMFQNLLVKHKVKVCTYLTDKNCPLRQRIKEYNRKNTCSQQHIKIIHPRKSMVRLTDRPDLTLDVYRGRTTTIQQQQNHTKFQNNRSLTGARLFKASLA